ncbi:MAG: putative ubiquitin-RnfH superfamily antitoxin RatB of RatAB toxin-antitoxin module [Candidatus Azotimanducaceae bacterium]|jgi:putative ubiquitin-RnfH superfamily antitoxin RatB of RatAB toxin-antitoxin module
MDASHMTVTNVTITVTVVYVSLSMPHVVPLELPAGATVALAIEQSGILAAALELNADDLQVGIYSRLVPQSTVLSNKDRVEIYRPLLVEPKEARRRRAQQRAAGSAKS